MKQPALERITFKHIIEEVLKVLNFKRGLLLTCRDLIIRPHKVLDTYLYKNRKHYTPPIQFSIFWVGLWALLVNMLSKGMKSVVNDVRNGITDSSKSSSSNLKETEAEQLELLISSLVDGFVKHQNVFQLLLIPLAALLTYFLYRKIKWYYTEHIVVNAYVIGVISMIGVLCFPLEFISTGLGMKFGTGLSLGYFIWCYMDLFQQRNFKGFLRAFVLLIVYYTAIMLLTMPISLIYILIYLG